jgi:outer membrane protein
LSRSLLVLALFALAAHARAQETVPLTLAEAVERARGASPRVEELRALSAAAAADLRGAKAERLPIVDLSASLTRYSNVPELVLDVPGRTEPLFPNIPNHYGARAELSLPLYTGGRVKGEIDAARHQLAAAEKDVDTGVSDLALETATAYWRLVAAREAARVLAESIESYDANLKQVRDRADVGMAARGDVLSVQVDRDRAELARLSAENAAALANEDLVRLLALPAGARVEPTEPLLAAAVEVEPTAALVARALDGRPEIASLRARVAAGQGRETIARAAKRPQASLGAGYDYARPNMRVVPPADRFDDSWSVGVNVAWRVFDGGRSSAAVARARAETDAARQRLADVERRVRLDVTGSALDLRTRRAGLEVADRTLESARENLKVAEDRYREGLVPASELLDAQARLLRAGLDRTEAATDVRQARATLDRAVGR